MSSDTRWALRWIVRAMIGLALGLLVTILLIVIVFLRLNGVQTEQHNDEHQTCVVQARGLPAGHHLAQFTGDIGELLKDAFVTETSRQKAATPKKTRALLEDLKTQGPTMLTTPMTSSRRRPW